MGTSSHFGTDKYLGSTLVSELSWKQKVLDQRRCIKAKVNFEILGEDKSEKVMTQI